jgi:hypothetical protein
VAGLLEVVMIDEEEYVMGGLAKVQSVVNYTIVSRELLYRTDCSKSSPRDVTMVSAYLHQGIENRVVYCRNNDKG